MPEGFWIIGEQTKTTQGVKTCTHRTRRLFCKVKLKNPKLKNPIKMEFSALVRDMK